MEIKLLFSILIDVVFSDGQPEHRVAFVALAPVTIDRCPRARGRDQHVAYRCPPVSDVPVTFARPRGTEAERFLAAELGAATVSSFLAAIGSLGCFATSTGRFLTGAVRRLPLRRMSGPPRKAWCRPAVPRCRHSDDLPASS
jgi:hypothetical protein